MKQNHPVGQLLKLDSGAQQGSMDNVHFSKPPAHSGLPLAAALLFVFWQRRVKSFLLDGFAEHACNDITKD